MFKEREQTRVAAQKRETSLIGLLVGALLLSLSATLALLLNSWWHTAGETIARILVVR